MQLIVIVIAVTSVALSTAFVLQSERHTVDLSNVMTQCDDQLLESCSEDYVRNIGIPRDANATRFMERINKKRLTMGKEFFLLEIASINEITYCLGDQMNDCLSKEHLVEVGLSSYDAAAYVAYLAIITNSATRTFSPIIQNFDCFFSVYNTTRYQNSVVPQCTAVFNAAVKKDPANLCPLGHNFLECLTSPFAHCGDDLVKAICDNSLASFRVNAPQCDGKIKCDFQT